MSKINLKYNSFKENLKSRRTLGSMEKICCSLCFTLWIFFKLDRDVKLCLLLCSHHQPQQHNRLQHSCAKYYQTKKSGQCNQHGWTAHYLVIIYISFTFCNELSNHADCIDLISLFYNVWRKNVGADCLVVVCYVNKEDDVAGHLNQV